MSNEELIQVLNTKLSPDKMPDYTPNELAVELMKLGLVENANDMNCMVIEHLQKIIRDGDEVPVHYYSKDEEMPEERKEVKDVECLTDDYIANNLGPL